MRSPRPRRITVVRYYLPDGTRSAKGVSGAVARKERSETWYAKITTGGRPKRVSLETKDEGTAWVNLRKLLRREKDRAIGVTDDLHEQAARPIAEHVADWIDALRLRGKTGDQQRDLLRARVNRVIELAGWQRLGDVAEGSCLQVLKDLQDGPGAPSGEDATPGISAQTRNHYARAVKQFARWCARPRIRRMLVDPLADLEMVSVETDRRHDRRSPSDAEVTQLFAYLESDRAKPRCRMTPRQRALGYKLAMATGFRASEIRSLERDSFDLDAGTVTVQAGYSKHRRRDTQHLPDWLTAELREWFGSGTNGLWHDYPQSFPGRPLKEDVIAAGIPYVVEGPAGPLFFDFHALRHWYCTQVVNQAGISPKTMMELTRHSTPGLALKTYGKRRPAAIIDAVSQIPNPSAPAPPPPAAKRGKRGKLGS